jgi:spore coat protein U-like protein
MKSWIAGVCLTLISLNAPGATCGVSALDLAFGNYDPFAPADRDSRGSITVSCQSALVESVPITVALTAGASGSFTSRQMPSGVGFSLRYNLYSNAARTMVWGDGTGGSSTVSTSLLMARCLACPQGNPNSSDTSLPVYGRAFARQNLLPPGNYLDTITVIVSF